MRKLSIKTLREIKRDFLDKKCREIFAQPKENLTREDLYAKLNDEKYTVSGFTLEKQEDDRKWRIDIVFTIKNRSKNGCEISFITEREKKGDMTILVPSRSINVSIFIDNTKLNWNIRRDFDFVNRVLRQFDALEKASREFSAEAEKQEKIRSLSQEGIQTWIASVLKETSYSYYTEESKNRVDLHIKFKRGMMLTIPIYYKSFQKIMPELLTTIRSYEDCFNAAGILTVIEKSPTNIQWNTAKNEE